MDDYLALAGLQVPEGLDLSQIPPRSPAQRINEADGTLNEQDGIDCPLCRNKGYIAEDLTDGSFRIKDCVCRTQRRSVRLARQSGLGDVLTACTFDAFETPDAWTTQLKTAGLHYLKSDAGKWFFVSGAPGTGKTHICTAVCRRLIGKGNGVRYMLWREDAPALKALTTEPEEYEAKFRDFADADVLYIDDLFKGRVTDGDVNLAFSLINARYNARGKRTIISTELPLKDISGIDGAVGSRIYERAKGFILFAPKEAKNWREE